MASRAALDHRPENRDANLLVESNLPDRLGLRSAFEVRVGRPLVAVLFGKYRINDDRAK